MMNEIHQEILTKNFLVELKVVVVMLLMMLVFEMLMGEVVMVHQLLLTCLVFLLDYFIEKSIKIMKVLNALQHPETATALHNKALCLHTLGRKRYWKTSTWYYL